MKTIIKSLVIVSIACISFAGFAADNNQTVLKSRKMVELAAADDWKALADAAKNCIDKKTNLAEANEWLDKSLTIKTTGYNLLVKGDYYMATNLPEKALESYVAAMKLILSENPNADLKELQGKITKAKEAKI